ncbi:hypothetical protein [Dyadobacter sp. CY323]|uniref:hypothetical protein n=1 Tax=Dyadobacter sp. CY323 TaxID=2907302 RepID=UPI001F220173|nr:hypothetical protein [Dyadobacter sp. CY323]MCE6990021.1 hypothetical protein [Dyadobacter sp. CY323]
MRNIECHYNDGSLVFCTTQDYTITNAHKILNIFHVAGLVSTIREKSNDLFNVVGQLPVDYDPFGTNSDKWSEVVSELTKTKEVLEQEVKAV